MTQMPYKEWRTHTEHLVSSRQTQKALQHLATGLSFSKNTEARLYMSDCYRRLGFVRRALQTLKIKNRPPEKMLANEIPEQIMACRHINLLGGSAYALKIIQRIPHEKLGIAEKQIIGNILLSNYEYQKALPLFHIESLKDLSKGTYQNALRAISVGDCLSGLRRCDEAIELCTSITSSNHPLLRFIANTALGEYCIDAGRYSRALRYLKTASEDLPPEDRSPDTAHWRKAMGIALMFNGNAREGKKLLIRSHKDLFDPSYKPEGWLEALYWLGFFEKAKVRKHWLKVLVYPHHSFKWTQLILDQMPIDTLQIVQNEVSPTTSRPNDHSSKILISNFDGVQNFGSLKKEELLALLIRGQDFGVPLFRVFEKLWPDEILAFSAHETRIQNLIFEARAQGHQIQVRKGSLKNISIRRSVLFSPRGINPTDAFLRAFENQTISRRDVETYFKIKRTKAGELLSEIQNSGRVKALPNQRWKFLVKPQSGIQPKDSN